MMSCERMLLMWRITITEEEGREVFVPARRSNSARMVVFVMLILSLAMSSCTSDEEDGRQETPSPTVQVEKVVVPDLIGLSIDDAVNGASQAGLTVSVHGTG